MDSQRFLLLIILDCYRVSALCSNCFSVDSDNHVTSLFETNVFEDILTELMVTVIRIVKIRKYDGHVNVDYSNDKSLHHVELSRCEKLEEMKLVS